MRNAEKPDTSLKYLSAGNATPGPTWARVSLVTQCTSRLCGVGIAGCAATYTALGSPGMEKRYMFWYATCVVTEPNV